MRNSSDAAFEERGVDCALFLVDFIYLLAVQMPRLFVICVQVFCLCCTCEVCMCVHMCVSILVRETVS
jgi:hypothetical protein